MTIEEATTFQILDEFVNMASSSPVEDWTFAEVADELAYRKVTELADANVGGVRPVHAPPA